MKTAAVPTPAPTSDRALVWGLAFTQTTGWGILFYSFPVLLEPMRNDLGWSRSSLIGGFALATVLSGMAAPAIGRHLDRDEARSMMTTGSLLAAGLVALWSRAETPLAFYAIWACLGLVQAGVLYDAALPVIIKRTSPRHTKALLTVTLAAGLASLIFQPLTSQLVVHHGWRTTVLVLALLLGATTIPVHALVLRPARSPKPPPTSPNPRPPVRERPSPGFWAITAAFTLAAMSSFSVTILLVTYLTDHGWTLSRAAFAAATLGAMQLPGRLAVGSIAISRHHRTITPVLLSLPAAGIALLLLSSGSHLVWFAVVVLGIGQGALLLLRATLMVDLYGTEQIGHLTGISAFPLTAARALAPLAVTVVAGQHGYAPAFLILIATSTGAACLARRTLQTAVGT